MRVDSGPEGLTFERAAVRSMNAPALSVIEVCCLPSLRIETWGTRPFLVTARCRVRGAASPRGLISQKLDWMVAPFGCAQGRLLKPCPFKATSRASRIQMQKQGQLQILRLPPLRFGCSG